MFESRIERLGRGILSEAKHVAASDPGQAAGPGDHEKAQGAHAAKDIAVGALAGAAPRLGDRVELKAAGNVVGEDAQRLPSTVRAVVAGGGGSEGGVARPFGARVFFFSAAAPRGRQSGGGSARAGVSRGRTDT